MPLLKLRLGFENKCKNMLAACVSKHPNDRLIVTPNALYLHARTLHNWRFVNEHDNFNLATPPATPSDSWTPTQIATAISNGDQEAESVLVKRYWSSLCQVLKGRNAPNPEDLCQEAFIVVIERLREKPLEDPTQLAGYLRNTAINLSIRDIRRDSRQKTDAASDLLDIMPALSQVEDVLDTEELRQQVRDVIQALPQERDRKVLWFYYVEDWDKGKICEHLNLESKAFNNVISRARLRVRQLVVEAGVGTEG